MSARVRHAVAPAYLLACLLLGGSSQGVWGNLALQLAGLLILAWALWPNAQPMGRDARIVSWLAAATVLLTAIQLIPLPPALWTALPGRGPVAEGFAMLGQPLPWLPLSLTPYETLESLLPLIPPFALLSAILRQGAFRSSWLALVIAGGALLSILLGALQISSGRFYLYRYSTVGTATGFFANGNYLGTLMLAAVPFLAFLVLRGAARRHSDRRRLAALGLAAGPLLVLVVGLAISGSLAAVILALPVFAATLLMLLRTSSKGRRWVAAAGAGLGVLALVGAAQLPAVTNGTNALSASLRTQIYRTSAEAVRDYWPVGSGAGSFARVYAQYEDLQNFQSAYVNHAHNDYLQIALEAGVPGLILLLLFLAWWLRRTILIWRYTASGVAAQAATIASAAILAHSLVDFPLRNSAIAAVLAVCVALMAEPRSRRREDAPELQQRPARHLTL